MAPVDRLDLLYNLRLQMQRRRITCGQVSVSDSAHHSGTNKSPRTDAVREGLFKDSDYDSVKQLDPISNGNLHRENRISKVIGQLLEGDDRYDPT